MKLTTLMLIIALVQASAAGFSQVKLSAKNTPLESVFSTLKKQTGYTFFYDLKDVRDVKITVQANDVTLKEALDKCFNGLPFNYEIKDKTVFVSKKEPTFIDKIKAVFLNIDVTGRVIDEQGRPVSSATVTVKGTSNSTITDEKGNFTLKGVDNKATIVVSVIGYDKKELPAAADLGTIQLVVAVSKLDEVQVIAYGETSQRLSTSNISSVKAADIEKQPVSDPLLALEGRVPGLFVTQSTGLANSGVTVRIQGQNSLNYGSEPLYVIDGVPYSSQLLPSLIGILGASKSGAAIGGTIGNPMSFINPADIESIDILKDADATAIYGSRAANGAVLITTKKGKTGAAKVNLNLQQGVGQVPSFLPLMNTTEYLQMRHQAKKNDNASILSTDYDINGVWDTTRNTNWQKTLIGGTARYTTLNGDISGGSLNTQYMIGGTYHRETTVFPGDFDDQKAAVHFNINSNSANQKFKVQFSAMYMVDNNLLPSADLTSQAVTLAPDAPALKNPDGSLNWAPNPAGNTTWLNGFQPLSYTLQTYQNKTTNLVSNGVLSYQIARGLEIRTSLGYTNLQSNELLLGPLTGIPPEKRANSQSSSFFGNNNMNSWNIEPQLTYKRAIGKGQLEALLGSTLLENSNTGYQFYGLGYTSDANLGDVNSAGTLLKNSSVSTVYKYEALFGRLNYNWDDKYIVNVTARRDGTSRFGPANQFHNFMSIGGAWIFSNETFFKDNKTFLSFGKLRGSYGTTGNDQIGDYQFLSLYSYNANVQVPYQGINPLQPTGLPNPYLQWEETRKLQFGVDLGFLKDRILFTANFVHNRSSNELLGFTLPGITGFSTITENLPATIQNTAWEFSLNSSNVNSKDFTWSTNFNLTLPKNKLVAFPGIENSPAVNALVVGQPFTIVKSYHFLGVDPATGLYQFAGKNGPTTAPVDPDDRTVLVNTSPTVYGGFGNTFRYKRLTLDVFFSFVKQNGPNFSFGTLVPGRKGYNQPLYQLGAWNAPGEITNVERYNSNNALFSSYGYGIASDAYISDASYARLKNASLSWQLPALWSKNAGLQNCSIYIQGQNLLTITKYKGLDPETLSSTSLPPLRVITVGLKVGL